MLHRKYAFCVAVAAAQWVAVQRASAIEVVFGTSPTIYPTENPVLQVGTGQPFTLYMWAKAQGTGFVDGMSVGVFQGGAPQWNGGLISSSNAFPAVSAVNGNAVQYSSNIDSIFKDDVAVPQLNAAGPTGYGTARLPWSHLGGASVGAPPEPITVGTPRLLATLTGTIRPEFGLGTAYLYLGRTNGGLAESPDFSEPNAILAQPGVYQNSTRFGFGDARAVATTGPGSGSGLSGVSVLSTNADATIVVVPEPAIAILVAPVTFLAMRRRRGSNT